MISGTTEFGVAPPPPAAQVFSLAPSAVAMRALASIARDWPVVRLCGDGERLRPSLARAEGDFPLPASGNGAILTWKPRGHAANVG